MNTENSTLHVKHIECLCMGGADLNDAGRDALLLAATEKADVIFTHNDVRYHVNFRQIIKDILYKNPKPKAPAP